MDKNAMYTLYSCPHLNWYISPGMDIGRIYRVCLSQPMFAHPQIATAKPIITMFQVDYGKLF